MCSSGLMAHVVTDTCNTQLASVLLLVLDPVLSAAPLPTLLLPLVVLVLPCSGCGVVNGKLSMDPTVFPRALSLLLEGPALM